MGEHVAIQAFSVLNAGFWEFDLNGGAGFQRFANDISATKALLLDSASKVRFTRGNATDTGEATLTFRAWDGTDANVPFNTTIVDPATRAGSFLDVSDPTGGEPANIRNGGITSVSATTAVAIVTLSTSGVNDAPVLNLTGQSLINAESGGTFPAKTNFANIDEDPTLDTSDNQQKITEWLNEDTVIDQESFAAGGVTGVAIVNTDDPTKGTWQFSTNGGTLFTAFAVT